MALPLRQTARQRLHVGARKIATRTGEHAVDLVRDVGIVGSERIAEARRVVRIEVGRIGKRRQRLLVLLVGAVDHRRGRGGTAAAHQVVGDAGRARREVAEKSGFALEARDRPRLRRVEPRADGAQAAKDTGQCTLRGCPWLGLRAGGGLLAAAAAHVKSPFRVARSPACSPQACVASPCGPIFAWPCTLLLLRIPQAPRSAAAIRCNRSRRKPRSCRTSACWPSSTR